LDKTLYVAGNSNIPL